MASNQYGLLADALRFQGLLGDPEPPTPPQIMRSARVPERPTPAPEPSRMQQFQTALAQVFAGQNDPRLGNEQNQQVQRQALLRAGLATMVGANRGQNTIEALAGGALTGQESGAQAREQAYMSTQEDRLRQALQNPEVVGRLTPQQMAMIQMLPPMEAVKVLSELAFKPAEAKVVGEGGVLVGADGQPIFENRREQELAISTRLRDAYHILGVDDPAAATPEQRQAARSIAENMARAGASQVNVGTREQQREFGNTNTLAGQFRSDVGQFQDVANSYGRVIASAQDPSAAGDMSLIFAYMKMLDPTSVVREGEQATAANAGSIPERIWGMYNRSLRGERFSADVRSDFVDRARRLAKQKQSQLQPVLTRYRRRASAIGMDPSLILYDPFEEIGISPGSGSAFGDLIPNR